MSPLTNFALQKSYETGDQIPNQDLTDIDLQHLTALKSHWGHLDKNMNQKNEEAISLASIYLLKSI